MKDKSNVTEGRILVRVFISLLPTNSLSEIVFNKTSKTKTQSSPDCLAGSNCVHCLNRLDHVVMGWQPSEKIALDNFKNGTISWDELKKENVVYRGTASAAKRRWSQKFPTQYKSIENEALKAIQQQTPLYHNIDQFTRR